MTALRSMPAVSARPPCARGRRWAGAALFLLLLAVLFTAYLRLSRTYPENSDEANLLLMASDWAHGNLYLSGWTVSDVPFITTELPELALAVRLFGLHLNTAHIAAAFTYTVVVALALLLAARGRRPVIRMAVAGTIMLAPQAGVGVFVLVFSVGHIGTAVPVLLAWLFLDRAQDRRRPRTVALVTGLLLAWALMADPLVLVIAAGPLLLVTAARSVTGIAVAGRTATGISGGLPNGGWLRRSRHLLATRRLELSLALAAAVAYLVAWGGQRLLRAAGGYVQQPVPWQLDPVSTWYAHSRTVAHGLLAMFGAYFLPGDGAGGLSEVLAVSRLACVALAAAGVLAAARCLVRRDADLVSQLLLTGLVANLAAYIPSSLADHTALNAREFAPVLPFAAVLAARMLGDRLGDWLGGSRARAAGLALLLGWYSLGLGFQAAAAAAANPLAGLESYLETHHLSYGIGGYWDASAITVDTGGAVTIRAVTAGCLQPYAWESRASWYDPARQRATFLVTSAGPGYFSRWVASPASLRQLAALVPAAGPVLTPGSARGRSAGGQPPGSGDQVRVYQGNVLAALPHLTHC
jgi:hypothetical protein